MTVMDAPASAWHSLRRLAGRNPRAVVNSCRSASPWPRLSQSARRSLWAYLFISPFYVSFAAFGVFPILFSLYVSMTRWTPFQTTFIGGGNFVNLLQDRLFYTSLFNSLWLTLVIGVVQLSLALVIAVALNQRRLRGRALFRGVLFLPYVTSPVILGLVWGALFAYTGVFNYALTLLGSAPVDWLGGETGSGTWIKPAIALVTVWQYFGWNVLLFAAGLQAIPAEIYDAARIDGAGEWSMLVRITLPMLRRVGFFVVSITIIGCIQLFDAPLMLLGGVAGGGSGTLGGAEAGGLTLAMMIYDTAFNYGQFGYAAATSVLMFGVLVLATLANRRVLFSSMED